MELINETGLEAAWVVGKIDPPAFALTAVVKGTFQLKRGQSAVLAEEQLPLTGDEYADGLSTKLLRYPMDFAPHKAHADILITGHCHTPEGKPAMTLPVTMRVGSYQKSVMVYGDRYWLDDNRTTRPLPFVRMPMTWEQAFGGRGFDDNPIGKGITEITFPDGQRAIPLPNVEQPSNLLTVRGQQVSPAGFGPIPDMWPTRMKKFGQIDDDYKKKRWPWYPKSFDWVFFNAAPEDQQIRDDLRGDEELVFEHLHPNIWQYRSFLPGLRIRCFLTELVRAHQDLREIPTRLDTVWVCPEEEKLILVWRGHLPVKTEKLLEVFNLFVMTEPIQTPPREREEVIALLHDAIVRMEAEDEELEPEAESDDEEETEEDESEETAEANEANPVEGGEPASAGEKNQGDLGRADKPAEMEAQQSQTDQYEVEVTSTAEEEAPEDTEDSIEEAAEESPDEAEKLSLTRIKDMIEARASFHGCDLGGLDLSSLDFSGLDLREAILEGAILIRANLSGANLSSAVLGDANLREGNCVEVNFADADLTGAWLTKANLTGANLERADLSKACLREARLSSVQARDSIFEEADLSSARLDNADLTGADLSKATMHHAQFTGSNMSDVAIEEAWGRGVEAQRANMTKVRGAKANLCGADFRGIEARGSVWEGAQLHGAKFVGGSLNEAELSDANLAQTTFEACEMKQSRLNKASLYGATMRRANLFAATLDEADLTRTDMRESNLYGATLMDAKLENTRLENANLRRIKTRQEIA